MNNSVRTVISFCGAWLIGTFAVLGIAVIATSGGNANESAALMAVCSAALLFTALLSRIELNIGGIASVISALGAIAAAWFWLVSTQQPDTSQLHIAGNLLYTIGTAGVLGLIVAIAYAVIH